MAVPARGPLFFMDPFVLRQFRGPRGISMDPDAFLHELHQRHASSTNGLTLVDGYAPFCKHVFVDNFADVPRCARLDVILYAREQLVKEHVSRGESDAEMRLPRAPYGVVSIKAQDVDHELPMQPITAMRNALGVEEGGSGVPLDRDAYVRSVAYWQDHVVVLDVNPDGP
mmetsp:Transcript_3040/g.10825  ORF Transcript_3040/g.10825 Transcript_3040/m.10825 type:complete len:170 (+) Transcript_3040:1258-1767(+)